MAFWEIPIENTKPTTEKSFTVNEQPIWSEDALFSFSSLSLSYCTSISLLSIQFLALALLKSFFCLPFVSDASQNQQRACQKSRSQNAIPSGQTKKATCLCHLILKKLLSIYKILFSRWDIGTPSSLELIILNIWSFFSAFIFSALRFLGHLLFCSSMQILSVSILVPESQLNRLGTKSIERSSF